MAAEDNAHLSYQILCVLCTKQKVSREGVLIIFSPCYTNEKARGLRSRFHFSSIWAWPDHSTASLHRHTRGQSLPLMVTLVCTCQCHGSFYVYYLCLLLFAGKLLLQHIDALIAFLFIFHELKGAQSKRYHVGTIQHLHGALITIEDLWAQYR